MSATGSSATATNDCWLAPSTDRGADPDQATRAEFPAQARPVLAEAVEEVGLDAGSGSGFGRAARCLAA